MTPEAPAHFQSMQLPAVPDHLAPDGSAIRSLLRVRGGSLASCTLPAGAVSHAVVHQTVEEIWYCLAGTGQVWSGRGRKMATGTGGKPAAEAVVRADTGCWPRPLNGALT